MKKLHIFLLLLIIAIGIGFRIYKLGDHDLWHDEVFGMALHQYPWQFITRITPRAPLHMIFVMYLTKLIDRGEFWVRLPAMTFGCASIILIYIFGKLLFNSQVGLIGAFFLSISPFHIWYSQEAGRYTQAAFFMILTSYFFIRCLREDKTWLWVSLPFIQAAGLYTSYLFSLIILPQMIIIVLFKWGRHIKRWLLSWCVVFLLFLPWLKVFISHVRLISENFWIPETTPFFLYITLCNFNLGYTVTPIIFFISFILWSAILIFALWNGLKKYRDSLIITTLFLIVPIISVFFMSQWKPIYVSRHILMFLPFYLLLVGFGVQSMRRKIFKAMSIVILLSLTSFSLINYYHDRMPASYSYHVGTYIKKPIRPVVEFVKRNFKQGDIIAYTNPSLDFPFLYYWGKGYKGFYFIVPEAQDSYFRDIFMRTIKTKGFDFSYIVDLSKGLTLPWGRIWVISSSWSRDGSLCSHSKAVLVWMETRYTLLFEKWMDGIRIGLYE